MRRLHYFYEMQIDYSIPVERCNYTIKCIPKDTMRQHVIDAVIHMEPETIYYSGIDGLGNSQIYGVNEQAHTFFRFQIAGEVVAGLADYEEEVDEDIAMIFKHPYGMNVAGNAISTFFGQHRPDAKANPYEQAVEMMHVLHNYFSYQSCSTDVDTTGEEAFVQGAGVCQDYAHIFIALMHLAGIPARYVTGLIVGEGASHAWVEVLWNDRWYGLDPTNDVIVADEHIKLGVGRDASDCMINRGIMHGGGIHTQTIRVNVF